MGDNCVMLLSRYSSFHNSECAKEQQEEQEHGAQLSLHVKYV